MSEPTTSEREARDRRALAVAELLRSGWTAKEVGAGMRVIDAGGGVELAMQTMRAAREGRARMSEPTTSEPSSAGTCLVCGALAPKRYGGMGRYLVMCIDCWERSWPIYCPKCRSTGPCRNYGPGCP